MSPTLSPNHEPYDLERFVRAQVGQSAPALAELRSGHKRTHWMWFVFPQLDGLGFSETARHYAIRDLVEARAYLEHPVLGPRLIECAVALNLAGVPSDGTLRLHMDAHAGAYRSLVETAAINMLRRTEAELTPLDNGLMPLDCDVTPFDNSDSKKEGVSRTYKGMDGYDPMAAYLGQKGDCLELELREGRQHCQKGTPAFLDQMLEKARRLIRAPLLVRLDGATTPSRTSP